MESIFTKIDKAVCNFNCFIIVRRRLAELEFSKYIQSVILSSACKMAGCSSSNSITTSHGD